MLAHPTIPGIFLHTDDELGAALGIAVRGRRTVHEWPLSCVQGVRLVDGTVLAYKSQLPPTVEPRCYDAATSPLLAPHRTLDRLGDCATMVIDWIGAPKLRTLATTPDELVAHGTAVVAEIARIDGDLPVHLDVSTPQRWADVVGTCLTRCRELVADGRFAATDPADVDLAARWAERVTIGACVVAHGDLTADQVFVADDGYRVIDWQRPVRCPGAVDLVSLLVGRHIDPMPYVDPAAIGMFWFLRLHWAVEAQHQLFPDQRWPLFERWAGDAFAGLRSVAGPTMP